MFVGLLKFCLSFMVTVNRLYRSLLLLRIRGTNYLPKSPVGCDTSSNCSVEDLEGNCRSITDVQQQLVLLRCSRGRRS